MRTNIRIELRDNNFLVYKLGVLIVIEENRVIGLGSIDNENNLVNAVDKYLKTNFHELYNENNIGLIFEKARDNEEIKLKIVKAVNKFIS